jgi:hypothetical protein
VPIYEIRAPNGKIYKFRGPEGAKQEDLFAYVQQQVQAEASADALRQEQQRQTGVFETARRGVSRGFGRLASTVTDTIPALAGSALGFDEYARRQLKEAEEKEAARQAESPTLYTSFRDIKGPGTALGYAAETIGEQVANILPGLGLGVTGARLGAGAASSAVARNLGERAAQQGLTGEAAETFIRRGTAAAQPAVTQGATRGALGGAFLGSYAQVAPEIFQNIEEDSGQLAPAAALLFSSAGAALESILPFKLSQQLTGPMRAGITAKLLEKSGMDRGLLRSVTAGALGGVAAEGATEGAQEAISIAAERFVNENPGVFGSKEWERILESTIRGAVAGGGFGGVGGGVEGVREGLERKRRYAEILERRGQQQEAAQLRREVEEAEAQIREIQATDPQMSLPGLEPEPYTQLVTPAAPAQKAAKEPKVTQGEMFTAEGAPTEAVETAAARAEKRATKQADEDRKAQEKLRRELNKNVTELADVPTDMASLARGPSPLETLAQQAQTFEGGQAPLPPSEIALAPVVTKDAYSKVLGIGRTASVWKAIEGKDLSDPAQAREVKDALTAYAAGKPAQGAAAKIETFLQDPAFQGVPDVGETVAGAGGEGVGVVSEPGIDAAPGTAGPVEPTGMETVSGIAGEPVAGEGAALGALTPEAPTEVAAPVTAVESEAVAAAEPEAAQPAVETPPAPVAETPAEVAAPAEITTPADISDDTLADAPKPKKIYRAEAPTRRAGLPEYPGRFWSSSEDLIKGRYLKSDRKLQATSKLPKRTLNVTTLSATPQASRDTMLRDFEQWAKANYPEFDVADARLYDVLTGAEIDFAYPTKQDVEYLRSKGYDSVYFEKEGAPSAAEQVDTWFVFEPPAPKKPVKGTVEAAREERKSKNQERQQAAAKKAADEAAVKKAATKPETKKAAAKPETKKAADEAAAKPKTIRPEKAAGESKAKLTQESERLKGELQRVIDSPDATQAQKKTAKDNQALLDDAELNESVADIRGNHENVKDVLAKIGRKPLPLIIPKAGQDLIDSAVSEVKSLPDTAYKGRAFTDTDRALLEKGNPNAVLDSLIASEKNPALRQVLRRIRALNLKTKIKIAPTSTEAEGPQGIPARGMYDPATDTIYLDPQYGMNAHTFVHEMVHAAISKVLNNRSHPLTKAFEKFFLSVQGRLSTAYGAQDLQEFAAELVSNPRFQALLKSIKTPKSESLFRHMMRSIAEFLGFAPKSNAFNQGLDFVNDIIDISSGIEPTSMEKLFLGNGDLSIVAKVGKAMPALTGDTVEKVRNDLSRLTPSLAEQAFGLMNTNSIYTIYKKELPAIKDLTDGIERRQGAVERKIAQIKKKYAEMTKVMVAYPAQAARLNDIAIDARLEAVDILDPDFKPAPDKVAAYTRLKNQFQSLPKPVQDVYRTIRGDYKEAFDAHRKILLAAAEDSPSLKAKLYEQFDKAVSVVSYVPFLRSGEFWVSYTDPETGELAAFAFESPLERGQFTKMLDQKKIAHRVYQNLSDVQYTGAGVPSTSFIYSVVKELRGKDASDEQINTVWQSYLATLPSGSIMKQFMKSKNVAGMNRDIVQGYGNMMIRWARKLSDAEYSPKIDRALAAIKTQAEAQPDPIVNAAARNILRQAPFLHNPTFNNVANAATTASYFMLLAGNISSALINLLSIPMSWSFLVRDSDWNTATRVTIAAGRTAVNKWGEMPRYKNLHAVMTDHAQLEHTQAREVLEGRKQKTGDYNNLKAKTLEALSVPLAVTEKYNRAVTAIAAYDLMKGKGASEADAVQYALKTVKDANTAGMAAAGPYWAQGPIGRVFYTFKGFVWNQASQIAIAFYQAFKGETPEVRKGAQRQLVAIYGMAFAIGGMRGLPFYGAVSTMSEMIAALFGDEDEPYDHDQMMKDMVGDFLFKGVANYATNLEIATRAGIASDLVFRDDPRFIAEHGYMLFALTQVLGPAGSLLLNTGRGYEQFQNGETMRAVETISPSWVRNILKGERFLREGATTLKGDPVMEDIGVYNSLMQLIGFAPADLADRYERLQAGKGYERELGLRRTNILRLYDMARQAGDTELMMEARERIAKFNETNPTLRITQSTLDRSLRARLAAEKEMINGVRFNKNLRPIIQERFFSEDED